ncbi:MAG TPA: hypothetical protein EYP22_06545 [Methanosarcinales archaeon]|nr:hypothetical protein [Methanosarcinales archaeon]
MNTLLRINLSKEKITEESCTSEFMENFIGGRGLATKLLTLEVSSDTEPLSEKNKLIFTIGPLSGSGIPFSGRHNLTSISPLTNTIFSSNAGGNFGYFLSKHDYIAIIVEGRCKNPLYLYISDEPQLLDAEKLWGLTVYCTHAEIYKMLYKNKNKKKSIACIGPAGENLVSFANIMVQKYRTFGRGGLGAVMGFKKLKAIVIEEKKEKKNEKNKFKTLLKKLYKRVSETPSGLKTYGTSSVLNTANDNCALPTRYYSETSFEDADLINGKKLKEFTVGRSTCEACEVACKPITYSPKYNIKTEGPEYETLMSFGSNLGVNDIEGIIKANDMCNELGIDTISCGNTIAALMQINKKVYYNINFGEIEKVHELIKLIAYKEDIGKELAKGLDKFAKKYNIRSYTVKGLDLPGHDARGLYGQGLGYLTSNRGADHLYSTMYMDEYHQHHRKNVIGKAEKLIYNENRNAILDSLVLCKFSLIFYDREDYVNIMQLVLDDKNIGESQIQKIGSDIINMERDFNYKRGFTKSEDVLPINIPNIDQELRKYYKLRGWE